MNGAEEAQPPPAPKYENSTLSAEKSERYLERLRRIMETEKPFTDGELTLQKLAEKLIELFDAALVTDAAAFLLQRQYFQ